MYEVVQEFNITSVSDNLYFRVVLYWGKEDEWLMLEQAVCQRDELMSCEGGKLKRCLFSLPMNNAMTSVYKGIHLPL